MARVKNVVAAVCEDNALVFVFPLAPAIHQFQALIETRHDIYSLAARLFRPRVRANSKVPVTLGPGMPLHALSLIALDGWSVYPAQI